MRIFSSGGDPGRFRLETFFGRERELATLLRVADHASVGSAGNVLLYGPPNVGKTSLLLKFREKVLQEKEGAFPFYFSFSSALGSSVRLVYQFAGEYLRQLLSFYGDDLPGGFDLMDLADRLSAVGVEVPVDFLRGVEERIREKDLVSALALALTLPFEVRKGGVIDLFLLDDFQFAMKMEDVPGWAILSVIRPYIKGGKAAFFIAGSSPGIVTASLKREGLYGSFSLLELSGLDRKSAREHFAHLVRKRKLQIPESVVELFTERLGGMPVYHRLLVDELTFQGEEVKDQGDAESFYARSVVEGRLNTYWREFFESVLSTRRQLARGIRFLKRVLVDEFPIDSYEGALGLIGGEPEDAEKILDALEFRGLLKTDFEKLSFVDDPVLRDFLFWAYERGIMGKHNTQIISLLVERNLFKRRFPSPDVYRREMLEAVKELLRRWDCQEVPAVLFDYLSFREKYGRKGILEVLVGMEEEKMKYKLPKVSSVSFGFAVGGRLPRIDFDVVGYGFRNREFTEEALVIWVVDFVEDRVLTRAKLEHFENRCRLLALEKSLGKEQLVRWVIFRGSVDEEALAYASSHGIYLTHEKQFRILLNIFGVEEAEEERRPVEEKAEDVSREEPLEFDLVIPMRDDAEVIAARVAEEISYFREVDRDTLDRIKMAIIEACINAFEHSQSESGLVKLRYVIDKDRVEVFVTDEGRGFSPRGSLDRKEEKRKRGWGLKIIRELVDEVDVVTGDEGTTIRLVKFLDEAEKISQDVKVSAESEEQSGEENGEND